MDGVLVDSEALHERSKREAFRRAGITLPESASPHILAAAIRRWSTISRRSSLLPQRKVQRSRDRRTHFTNRWSLHSPRYRVLSTLFVGHTGTFDLPWQHQQPPEIGSSSWRCSRSNPSLRLWWTLLSSKPSGWQSGSHGQE